MVHCTPVQVPSLCINQKVSPLNNSSTMEQNTQTLEYSTCYWYIYSTAGVIFPRTGYSLLGLILGDSVLREEIDPLTEPVTDNLDKISRSFSTHCISFLAIVTFPFCLPFTKSTISNIVRWEGWTCLHAATWAKSLWRYWNLRPHCGKPGQLHLIVMVIALLLVTD